MLEDKQLVENFLGGDEQALEALIERYLKPLYGFVFQFTQDRNTAEDIVQEVFVKVWKNLAKFDQQKKFSTWIFAIAKNAAYDWLKKKKTIPFSVFENLEGENALEFIAEVSNSSSQEVLSQLALKNELKKMLAELPEISRSIVLLHHAQGFSLVEIAEIFGQPKNTIKSQYRRSLLSLRKQFFAKSKLRSSQLFK